MSTYYYLVCKEHEEYCDAVSSTCASVCHLGHSVQTLPTFLYRHRDCLLTVESEHAEPECSYAKWTVDCQNQYLAAGTPEDFEPRRPS